MRRLVFLVTVLALGLLLPVRAQSNVALPTDCSVETVQSVVSTAKTMVDGLDAALVGAESIDGEKFATNLEALSLYFGLLQAQCQGLVFEGDGQDVIGPVMLTEGVYKVTLETDKSGTGVLVNATVNAMDGKCGQGSGSFLLPSLFLLASGDAETVFTSEGCTALIEVQPVGTSWKLSFQKLN